jgi:C4-dicarboxylate transporter DctM subunit
MVCSLGIGFQTPPLGENLFIASGISKISIEEISLKALPFAAINTVAIFIIAYFPALTLWLPRALGFR